MSGRAIAVVLAGMALLLVAAAPAAAQDDDAFSPNPPAPKPAPSPTPRQGKVGGPLPVDNSGCWSGLPEGKLCVDGGYFKDGHGNVVILRGVNLAGTSKVPPFLPLPKSTSPRISNPDINLTSCKDPAGKFDFVNFNYPANTDFSKLNALPAWGVNVLRLLFIWEAYEPCPNVYNKTYLTMLQQIAQYAWQLGIYTVVDFHQDVYSRWLAGDPRTGGCGEGFPKWTMPSDLSDVGSYSMMVNLPAIATLDPPGNGPPPGSPPGAGFTPGACADWMVQGFLDRRVHASFHNLYKPNSATHKAYVATVATLANTFRQTPGVVGYDLLNEPFSNPSESELQQLYAEAGAAVRNVDPKAILFLEPNLRTDTGFPTLQRPSFSNVAYSPHYYDTTTTTSPKLGNLISFLMSHGSQSSSPGVALLRQLFNQGPNARPSYKDLFQTEVFYGVMQAQAKQWNAALFVGEFGAPPTVGNVEGYLDKIHALLNVTSGSAAQWSYAPGWTWAGKDGWDGEDLSIVDNRNELRSKLYRPRPYPQQISGTPVGTLVEEVGPVTVVTVSWNNVPTLTNEVMLYLPRMTPKPTAENMAKCVKAANPVTIYEKGLQDALKCLPLLAQQGSSAPATGVSVQKRGGNFPCNMESDGVHLSCDTAGLTGLLSITVQY